MLLRVFDLLLAALEFPCSPGSDDLHLGSKSLDGKLETHLIVALAGAAVADGVRTLGESNLDDSLGNDRTCKAGTQQILVLVNSARLQRGIYIIVNKFLLEVGNVELGSASRNGLFLKTVQLGALTYIARNSDHLAAVVIFLQPRNNDGCVQSSRISDYYLFDFRHVLFLRIVFLYMPQKSLMY